MGSVDIEIFNVINLSSQNRSFLKEKRRFICLIQINCLLLPTSSRRRHPCEGG